MLHVRGGFYLKVKQPLEILVVSTLSGAGGRILNLKNIEFEILLPDG